jgi:hypothetical protein
MVTYNDNAKESKKWMEVRGILQMKSRITWLMLTIEDKDIWQMISVFVS